MRVTSSDSGIFVLDSSCPRRTLVLFCSAAVLTAWNKGRAPNRSSSEGSDCEGNPSGNQPSKPWSMMTNGTPGSFPTTERNVSRSSITFEDGSSRTRSALNRAASSGAASSRAQCCIRNRYSSDSRSSPPNRRAWLSSPPTNKALIAGVVPRDAFVPVIYRHPTMAAGFTITTVTAVIQSHLA